jgi:hypothetical protein
VQKKLKILKISSESIAGKDCIKKNKSKKIAKKLKKMAKKLKKKSHCCAMRGSYLR